MSSQLAVVTELLLPASLLLQAVLLPGGDKVLLYGGEDSHRRPLSDVHVLDLQVRSNAQAGSKALKAAGSAAAAAA